MTKQWTKHPEAQEILDNIKESVKTMEEDMKEKNEDKLTLKDIITNTANELDLDPKQMEEFIRKVVEKINKEFNLKVCS